MTIEAVKQWGSVFPKMKLCVSNHGERWGKKATLAGIPSLMMRQYQEVIGAPPGWHWQYEWRVDDKHPFRVIHGLGFSGVNGHRDAAVTSGISTAIGHLHANAGISYICTGFDKDGLKGSLGHGRTIWGMNTGCTINRAKFAFKYGRDCKWKPVLTGAIVANRGAMPILIPYEV